MAKSPKGSSAKDRNPLPFEPRSTPKKPSSTPPSSIPQRATASSQGIPPVISQRMVRRILLFCGIPSLLGFLAMPAGYLVISNDWLELPNASVILVSMGFLGLGVVGLSYGIFSASWDEDQPGTRLGFQEFKLNLGRTIAAWRQGRADPS